MVPEDHRLCAGIAGWAGHAAGLARRGQDHAAQLAGSQRRAGNSLRARRQGRTAQRVHHPSGHADGRDLPVDRRGASAGAEGGAGQPATGRLHRRDEARRRFRSGTRNPGKARHGHRPARGSSGERRAGADLGRQLRADGLRHRRGDGGAGARSTRLGIRAEVQPADPDGDRRSVGDRSLERHRS